MTYFTNAFKLDVFILAVVFPKNDLDRKPLSSAQLTRLELNFLFFFFIKHV